MGSPAPTGRIVARATEDWLLRNDGEYIAIIVASDHPRYTVGEKLDWHRLTFALHDGYSVEITPAIE